MTLISVDDSTFVEDVVFLSLGAIRRFLMVSSPFKCTWIQYFLQVLLKLSLKPWWYGTTMFGLGLLGCAGLELSVLLLVRWLDVS